VRSVALASALVGALWGAPLLAQEPISHGRFKEVTLYRPEGDVRQVVLFLSGDDGWTGGVVAMARALLGEGAMVAGIDVPQLYANLDADGDACVFPDGDLENLSHYLQGYAKLPSYYPPTLVGYSSGATLAYAMIAQAPTGTFAGALSVGFCPTLELTKPLCVGEGVHSVASLDGKGLVLLPDKKLRVSWVALQGEQDPQCDVKATQSFVAQVPGASLVLLPNVGREESVAPTGLPLYLAAFSALTAKHAATVPVPPATLADLPLVEVPAEAAGDTFAVLLSGDGGWAGLDQGVAGALAAHGVPVAGLDSLRYFWSARTPQGLADDLDRVLGYYAARWHKSRALLIGYSQGADVLPFAVNRLSPEAKALTARTILIGLGEFATFEFHLSTWLGADDDGEPILPEAEKLSAGTTLCLYGTDDDDSICPRIAAGHVDSEALPGGHHFNGAYEELAAIILARTGTR
jgi:type IV secretory pathway VirJ component